MKPLYRIGAGELAQRNLAGRGAVAETARAHLARCAQLDPGIGAWQHLAGDRAMDRAEALDAARDRGEPAGPLHGVPVGVKDIIDVAGMPTTLGSQIHAGHIAEKTAACVQQLERAGAVVLGKTVSTEFAYYTPGKTRNPWNTARTPGGSSMGSAAAVAAGMAAGALGTQTNGSVIRPAAFCGVVGFKPSYGWVANDGTMDPWPTLDHTGVFARSVADAALLAAAIVEPGRLAGTVTLPQRAPPLVAVPTPVWHLAETVQKEMLASNLGALRHAGATIDEAELPLTFLEAHRAHRAIMAYEGALFFRALQERERARMSAAFNELIDEGAGITDARYDEALRTTASLQREFDEWIADYDAVLTPPAAGEAPATLEQTGSPAFCTIWTMLGVPALTLPVGLGPGGMPLGLQIAGPRDRDADTLAVAAWCEARLPFSGWPIA
jgi:Asp-tRNA(Asn)/Glu-tRNA(Gln) amidotransferase A subunit family amidase